MDEESFPCPACLKPLVVDTKDQVTYFCMNCGAKFEPDAETLIDLFAICRRIQTSQTD